MMQTLLVDFGNSRIKWALHDNQLLRASAVLSHRQQALPALLAQAWADLPVPQRVVIASVADPARTAQLTQWIRQHWSRDAEFIVSPAQGNGLSNSYQEPAKLGCDRWAAMVAAYHAAHAAVCVVDCGSAVTVDVVDAGGQHRGGLILPGVHSMDAALTAHTALAPLDFSQLPNNLLGTSTQAAIACGITHAITALVHQTLAELAKTLGINATCYLTGGDAEIIAPLLHVPYVLAPDLVLQGLAHMAHAT
jgi:type III pantothenate kinase